MDLKDLMIRVTSVSIGDTGANGAMGATLAEVENLVLDSVVLSKDANDIFDLEVEDADAPILSVIAKAGSFMFTFGTNDMKKENLSLAFGGTESSEKWSAPVSETVKEQSIKIITRSVDGYHRVIDIPRAMLSTTLNGELKRGTAAAILFECKALAPIDGSGDPISPIQIDKIVDA